MGLRRGHTDEEWREPAAELVCQRECVDYRLDSSYMHRQFIESVVRPWLCTYFLCAALVLYLRTQFRARYSLKH